MTRHILTHGELGSLETFRLVQRDRRLTEDREAARLYAQNQRLATWLEQIAKSDTPATDVKRELWRVGLTLMCLGDVPTQRGMPSTTIADGRTS